MSTKVAGFWSGHDTSFCVLENGRPIIHTELERHLREKEPSGDSVELFRQHSPVQMNEIGFWATSEPSGKVTLELEKELGPTNVTVVGHHLSHAAHAFYSCNIKKALIITIDGGGIDKGVTTATTVWEGDDKNITPVKIFHINQINIGGLWTRATRYIFRLQNGWPKGHQAGTVMAMAALGTSDKYVSHFETMLGQDLVPASMKPRDQPVGAYTGNDPKHPYLNPWTEIADSSEQEKWNLAYGLQIATENQIRDLIDLAIKLCPNHTALCIAGGVALNSVAIGKIQKWFPQFTQIFVPPVPYDGGLCIGAAQYLTHHIHQIPRVEWDYCFPPYLGKQYSRRDIETKLFSTILREKFKVQMDVWDDKDAIKALVDQKIVSIFHGRAESGRRALGSRSIVADPRSESMKDKVNTNVKHRQSFRPFAPSILRENIQEIFEDPQDSPYMTHVCKFKYEWQQKVPAVVHVDGSARLQTVDAKMSPWWHQFISLWYEASGVPVLLNTSFNDSEPIVEDAEHAIKCFMGTEIDYLYFPELSLVVKKT